jgi:serine/threonine-protein kinase
MRVGLYEVISLLGAGGMGEVYRARDTKLGRDVAIKVLPESVAADPQRLSRFRREAQVLASLNHPNIASIYGFEDFNGTHALVMELVAGSTLTSRISDGPMPVVEALLIAKQIAEALDAAHEQGIVHRDLKPANVLVTPDGVVKVVDFGLARSTAVSGPTPDSSASPTLTVQGTREGVILGTAAYMSPEQAKGRPVDKRTDLWAFGAILYEMLTGRRAFEGEDVSDILANILTKAPDWSRLPESTPGAVVRLLRRCLEKDRKQRLDSAAVARFEIDEVLSAGSTVAKSRGGRSPRWSVAWATVAVVVSALVTFALTRTLTPRVPRAAGATSRLAIVLPSSQLMPTVLLDRDLAVSPDGRFVVYRVGGSVYSGGQLALRAADELQAHLITGIDNARAPFFSPDGRWIGFVAGSELKRVSTAGGPAITICQGGPFYGSASWASDDTIVFGHDDQLFRVLAAGGEAKAFAKTARLGSGASVGFTYTSFLPEGRGALVTLTPLDTWFAGANQSQVAVVNLKTGELETVIRNGSAAQYVGSRQEGYLVYASAGTLFAVAFDLDRLKIQGDPVPVVDHIAMAPGGGVEYDLSRTGTLIYVPAGPQASRSIVWVDRAGRETPTALPPRAYVFVRLSPDGRRAALTAAEDTRIWIGDVMRGTLRGLTFGSNKDGWPVWTPDSRSIVFDSDRAPGLNLYSQLADGSAPAIQLTNGSAPLFANSIARDGRILAAEFNVSSSSLDVVWLSAVPKSASDGAVVAAPAPFVKAGTLVSTRANEYDAILSPNGQFFAYQSNESGRNEIYVKPFPQGGEVRWQVSSSGGTAPVWAPDGGELYYRDLVGGVMAVAVDPHAASWQAGTPAKLFEASYAAPTDMFNFDVSPDGQRFLMLKETPTGQQSATTAQIVVVQNWLEELKRLVPTK